MEHVLFPPLRAIVAGLLVKAAFNKRSRAIASQQLVWVWLWKGGFPSTHTAALTAILIMIVVKEPVLSEFSGHTFTEILVGVF